MVIPIKMDDKLHKLLKRNNITYYEVPADHFNDKHLEQDLEKIYKFAKKQAKNIQILREYHISMATPMPSSTITVLAVREIGFLSSSCAWFQFNLSCSGAPGSTRPETIGGDSEILEPCILSVCIRSVLHSRAQT